MSKKTPIILSSVFSVLSDHWKILEHLQQKRTIATEQRSEAGPDAVPLPGVEYKGQKFKTVQLRYRRGVKRVTLLRTLISKVVFQPDKITRVDFLLIYDNLIYVQDIARLNSSFTAKFGSSLEVLTKHLKGFRLTSRTTRDKVKILAEKLRIDLSGFYIPERNLSTELAKVEQMYALTPFRSLGTETKLLKPKAHIGKGYDDHGAAKDKAQDGSPSWQEVAQSDLDGEFKEEKPNENSIETP